MASAFGSRLHILIHASPILKHRVGFRLSAPYLKTCIAYLNTWSRLSARPTRLEPESAANQNRARKKPSNFVSQPELSTEKTIHFRQPIRIEYYITRDVSQSESSITSSLRHPRALGSGWRPFSALGFSRLAIAYLNTLGSPGPLPHQLTLLLLKCLNNWIKQLIIEELYLTEAIFPFTIKSNFSTLRSSVENSSNINGCQIAFTPDDSKRRLFGFKPKVLQFIRISVWNFTIWYYFLRRWYRSENDFQR